MTGKAVPQPTPQTQPFWDGCSAGELRLQWCRTCARHYFPPQARCPVCLQEDVTWMAVSGRARLHTYVINHSPAPGFEDAAPYAIAIVELHEGPRMMTNVIGVENTPEALVLDMELEVTFEERGDVSVPLFRPVGMHP
jgi:uncharacterized OB-fold protein